MRENYFVAEQGSPAFWSAGHFCLWMNVHLTMTAIWTTTTFLGYSNMLLFIFSFFFSFVVWMWTWRESFYAAGRNNKKKMTIHPLFHPHPHFNFPPPTPLQNSTATRHTQVKPITCHHFNISPEMLQGATNKWNERTWEKIVQPAMSWPNLFSFYLFF